MITNFSRVLRLKDMEVWDVKIEPSMYRIIIFDERRTPTIEDFYPDKLMEDDLRTNLVTVSIYSSEERKLEHIYSLVKFYESLTNHLALAHTNIRVTFQTKDLNQALEDFLFEKYGIKEILWHKHINFHQE